MDLGPFAFEEVASGLATSATQPVSRPWIHDREVFNQWNPPRWVYRLRQTEDLLHERVTIKDEERLAYWRSYSSFSARLGLARECAIIGAAATPFHSVFHPQSKDAISPERTVSKKTNGYTSRTPAPLSTSAPSGGDGSSSCCCDVTVAHLDTGATKQRRCHRLAMELVQADPFVRPLWLSRRPTDYTEWRVDLYLRSESENPSMLISVGPFFCPYATELGVLSDVLSVPEDRFLLFPPTRGKTPRRHSSFSPEKARSVSASPKSCGQHLSPFCFFSPFPPTSEERQCFDKKMLYTPLIWEEPFTVSAEVNAKEISVWSEFWELYGQRVSSTGLQNVYEESQEVGTQPSIFPAGVAESHEGAAASIPSSLHAAGTVANDELSTPDFSPFVTHPKRNDLWGLVKDELPFTTSLPLGNVPLYEMYLRLVFRSRTNLDSKPKREIEVEFSVGTLQNSKKSEKRGEVQGTEPAFGESSFRSGSLALSALFSSPSLTEATGTKKSKGNEVAKQEKMESSGELEVSSCASSASSVATGEFHHADKDYPSAPVEEFHPLQAGKDFFQEVALRSPEFSKRSKAVVFLKGEAEGNRTAEELRTPVDNEGTFPIRSLPDGVLSPSSTSSFRADGQKIHASLSTSKSEKGRAVDALRPFLRKPKESTHKHMPDVKWEKVESSPLRLSLPREASQLVFCPYVTLMSSGDAAAVIGGSCGCVEGDTRYSGVT